MWTRKEFEAAGQRIGEDFVSSGCAGSINERSVKEAQAAGLNPEGIRTMVRLANVAAFEKFFEKGAAEKADDRMIEFAVGDAEMVISQLYSDTKVAQEQEKVAAGYDQTFDYYSDVEYTPDALEKSASAIPGVELTTPPDALPSRQEVVLLLKKAEDKMRDEQRQVQYRWHDSLEKAAKLLRVADGRVEARNAFEKNAASLLGEDIVPELRMVNALTSPKGAEVVLFGGEKLAAVLETHIASVSKDLHPIIELLKVANAARKDNHVKAAGLKWLEENRTRVSK